MSTRIDLLNRVYDDLKRTDVSTAVDSAVTSAIRHYNRERWWFLEAVAETTTSSSQAYYVVPPDMKKMDNLLITISGSKVPLDLVSYDEIDNEDDGRFFGQPVKVAMYQDSLRLSPVPNGEFVITMSYHRKLDESTTGSVSNSWTNEGFDLIRYRAAYDVAKHTLRNRDLALGFKEDETDTYHQMVKENIGRISTGQISRSQW